MFHVCRRRLLLPSSPAGSFAQRTESASGSSPSRSPLDAACCYCCYSPLEAAKLSNFQQNSPVRVPVTLLLLSGDQSARRECEREGEGEKPKAGGRALKPSHRLQVLPLCFASTEAELLMQMQMKTRACFLFRGKERGGGGSPNCLSTGSGRILKNGEDSGAE